jgi:hypothetical protein
MLNRSLRVLFGVIAFMFIAPQVSHAADYYVDSVAGNNGNAGTSSGAPWQTLAPVNSLSLSPGDTVHLKRGSTFTGAGGTGSSALTLGNTGGTTDNGTSGSPVTVTDYGTGNLPILQNTGQYSNVVNVYSDWTTVENILVRDTSSSVNGQEGGITLRSTSDHATVSGIEATQVGLGVILAGTNGRATDSYVHDLKMVVNTSGGDDDYGAVCFWNENHNNEIDNNHGENCSASSFDYGTDGGFVEVWSKGDNLSVHHNLIEDTDGMMEMGGPGTGSSAVGIRYHDNVALGSNGMCLHMSGSFAMTLSDIRIENNSIYDMSATDKFFQCVSGVTTTKLKFRNNAYKSNVGIITSTNGTPDHAGNVISSSQAIGFTLASDEVSGDPQFVSTTDLHLQSTSPAIDLPTLDLWSPDFDGNSRPAGNGDSGAYEYQASGPDTTDPTTTITGGTPSNPTSSNSASISFTGSDNVAVTDYECRIDAGTYASCTSPKAYSSLTDGSHTFDVRAKDAAGNVDQTPASATWVVDTTAPDTSITSNPTNPSTSSSASFSFTSPDGTATFECRLDAGSWGACTSPKAYSSLSNGSHTFDVRAKDPVGNTDATPATYTWTVAVPLTLLNDNTTSGTPRWTYGTGWSYAAPGCGGCSGKYQGDDHYTNTANATATMTFSGTQVKLYARKNSHHGEATVQIDGGTITTVDMYASTLTDQALIYTSPTLSSGSHSLVFKRKGTKNPSSTDYYVVVDRADITP